MAALLLGRTARRARPDVKRESGGCNIAKNVSSCSGINLHPNFAAMGLRHALLCFVGLVSALCEEGCSTMGQSPEIVKVRDPGVRAYRDESVTVTAPSEWEYAVMSENSYRDHWSVETPIASRFAKGRPLVELPRMNAAGVDCLTDGKTPLPLAGWYRWADFPEHDPALEKDADKQQLFFEVWQKDEPGAIVAIVFRGTVPAKWQTWAANFRWFLPFHPDQYTIAAGKLALDFALQISNRIAEGALAKNVEIVAAGHSLGGGLAQQIAYALPTADAVPRISKVFAFDPSPVTGYYSVNADLRDANKQKLNTYRIFEHGEVLAYLRLLLSYVIPPSASAPAISEIRYHFDPSWNFIQDHSMATLACGITKAAGQK